MERIGFGPRFGAALIDAIILIVVMMALGAALGTGLMAGGGGFSIAAIIIAIIPLAYYSTEIIKAATPGKMALKLIIRNEDGSPAPQDVLIKRFLVKSSGSIVTLLGAITTITLLNTVGGIIGFVIFIGCFLVFSESKQALHDRVAKTAVFKA